MVGFPVASLDPERRLAAARRRLDNGQGLSDEMRARVLSANAAALRELALVEMRAEVGEVRA